MSRVVDRTRDAILKVLGNHWRASVAAIADEDFPFLQQIAHDAARWANNENDDGLRHAEAQLAILKATVEIRENRELRQDLKEIIILVAQTAREVLKAAAAAS